MKISLLTDAPKHNLALMKISAWHKRRGDRVALNVPLFPSHKRYASVLFDWNKNTFIADEYGGPAFPQVQLDRKFQLMIPDYSLFDIDYSLGYTYRYCPRNCAFCKVTQMETDKAHYSIWDFHEPTFTKICLLNNNTFADKRWKETFEEIWDANLTVIDENGYDLRLMDEEKTDALKRTKFEGQIHFAWDRMKDEKQILRGLELLKKYKIRGHIYVLVGYDTTREEDMYRCQKLADYGQDPYIMPYNSKPHDRAFKRFIDTFMWRKYKTIEQAWNDYKN